jgi:hypothetical protein
MSDNSIININSKEEKNGNISIKSTNDYFKEMYYFSDIFNEREYTKFIKEIERTIRRSNEYRDYVKAVKDEYPIMRVDNILSNISEDDASIELHHYPFTLYDIVDIFVSDAISKEKLINSHRVAKEIMKLHYENIIGLVPMTITMHELTHQGLLFLSKQQIFGNYQEFIDRYKNVITDDMKDKLDKISKLSDHNVDTDYTGLIK